MTRGLRVRIVCPSSTFHDRVGWITASAHLPHERGWMVDLADGYAALRFGEGSLVRDEQEPHMTAGE